MKQLIILLSAAVISIGALAAPPTHYFIGQQQVSEALWRAVPDSLKIEHCYFDQDTLVIEQCRLPFTHSLDTTSQPDTILIRQRPQAEIDEIIAAYAKAKQHVDSSAIKLNVGDKAPDLSLNIISTGQQINTREHCCLITFWAFWCGNCLKELQEEYLPTVARRYIDRDDFLFIPICIDADMQRIEEFVHGHGAQQWPTMSAHTSLDTDRSLNALFATPGLMPLNIVIGKDGTIRMLHCGSITSPEQLAQLSEAIETGLSNN
ncbi:MAG: TlpA family protein disulfide reductase [Alistipes sp.]|nr:TlpA family protein disulfide reductase [Alistipes sp.]